MYAVMEIVVAVMMAYIVVFGGLIAIPVLYVEVTANEQTAEQKRTGRNLARAASALVVVYIVLLVAGLAPQPVTIVLGVAYVVLLEAIRRSSRGRPTSP